MWDGGDDEEAGGAGAVDVLVSGMPALGGDGRGGCSGGRATLVRRGKIGC